MVGVRTGSPRERTVRGDSVLGSFWLWMSCTQGGLLSPSMPSGAGLGHLERRGPAPPPPAALGARGFAVVSGVSRKAASGAWGQFLWALGAGASEGRAGACRPVRDRTQPAPQLGACRGTCPRRRTEEAEPDVAGSRNGCWQVCVCESGAEPGGQACHGL